MAARENCLRCQPDFTYLRCCEGVVCFSFVIDAYSRRIVRWQFAEQFRERS